MKKMMMFLALALLAGCATKEMKSTPFYEGDDVAYTGRPEDRVNVWPVAYWREPVGSVLWPIISFSDDHFALRPLYSQYRQSGKDGAFDEFNFLWPLCQADLRSHDYCVFPFFWGWNNNGRRYQTLFPIYWNGAHYNHLVPLWFYEDHGERMHLSSLLGMVGASSEEGGRSANWCFPLWYWNSGGTFVTAAYGRWENGWAVPPLASWGESEANGDYSARCLLGLGGVKKRGENLSHWAFPLYRWEDKLGFDARRIRKMHLLMDFVGWERKGDELVSSYAFPIYSWERDERMLTPLFYWDSKGSFLTPLGGRTVSAGTTNHYATLLVKRTSGAKTGGMVFPAWSRKTDCDFAEKAKMLDSTRLPDDVCIRTSTTTNMVWNEAKKSNVPVVVSQRRATWLSASDTTDWLLVFPWHDRVNGHLGRCDRTNSYDLVRTVERGNDLLLKYGHARKVSFSALDRSKESDTEDTDVSLLVWFYTYTRHADRLSATSSARHRVLWKLWDWERSDGDVSLDVFPGFTYDSKTNGYTKTSLLWRLFRYESDPEKGTAADLLFIPIWR